MEYNINYNSGTLLEKLSAQETREKIIRIFSSILETNNFETNVNLVVTGFDSISLVMLVTLISEEFGVELPIEFFLEHFTVDSIIEYLVREGERDV